MKPYPTKADIVAAAAGDAKARARVVEGMEGMCHFVARRYAHSTHLPLEELVQECRFSVLYAINAFKPRLGVKFETYAFRWMRALVLRLIIAENPNDTRNRRHGAVLGAGHRGEKVHVSHVSFSVESDDGLHLGDRLPDTTPSAEQQLAEHQMALEVRRFTKRVLEGHDRHVTVERANGRTLESIGEGMNLSRERVRQIEMRAMRKLREHRQELE